MNAQRKGIEPKFDIIGVMREANEDCSRELLKRLEGQDPEEMNEDDYDELALAHDPDQDIPVVPYRTFFDVDCPVSECPARFKVSSHPGGLAVLATHGDPICQKDNLTI